MARGGRRRRSTQAEKGRVMQLIDAGVSRRRTAEMVFGDRRYKGRVDRIVRAHGERAAPATAQTGSLAVDTQVENEWTGAEAPSVRDLTERLRASLHRRLESGEEVRVGEIMRLLGLEQRLDAVEAVEQLNALTRQGAG